MHEERMNVPTLYASMHSREAAGDEDDRNFDVLLFRRIALRNTHGEMLFTQQGIYGVDFGVHR